MKYKALKYNEIRDLINGLYNNIKMHGFKPDKIIAISSGGLIPAKMLSDLFGCHILFVDAYYYKGIGERMKKPKVKLRFDADEIISEKILIVDDVSDSGETLRAVIDMIKEFCLGYDHPAINTATIHVKTCSKYEPDFCISKYIPEDTWIIYPWEQKKFAKDFIKKKYKGKLPYHIVLSNLLLIGIEIDIVKQVIDEYEE